MKPIGLLALIALGIALISFAIFFATVPNQTIVNSLNSTNMIHDGEQMMGYFCYLLVIGFGIFGLLFTMCPAFQRMVLRDRPKKPK